MAGEPLGISANISFAVAKYSDEWSQEDISAGRAVPYEVVQILVLGEGSKWPTY